jgi:hypothetical protein
MESSTGGGSSFKEEVLPKRKEVRTTFYVFMAIFSILNDEMCEIERKYKYYKQWRKLSR